MAERINRRVLSLCLKNNRDMVRKTLVQKNYKVSFISELSEVSPSIVDFKPKIFVHDWSAVDSTQSRLFHLKFGKAFPSAEIIRLLIAPEVSPSLIAFASDAMIEKVLSYSLATLNLASQIEMISSTQESNELSKFLREVKADGYRYSQKEIDDKIDELFQKYPHDNRVRLEFGNLSYRQDKLDDALFLAKDLLMREPDNMRALNLVARSLLKKGEFDKAFTALEKANILSPSNPDRLIAMGNALYGKGDLDEAVQYYRQAVKIDPESRGLAHRQIGQVRLAQGQIEEALDLFKGSVSEEEAAGFFNNAAVKAVRVGQLEKALSLYETALKAVRSDKLKPLIYFNIALSLRRLGRDPEATQYLQRSLKYNPNFKKAKVHLDLIAKKTG